MVGRVGVHPRFGQRGSVDVHVNVQTQKADHERDDFPCDRVAMSWAVLIVGLLAPASDGSKRLGVAAVSAGVVPCGAKREGNCCGDGKCTGPENEITCMGARGPARTAPARPALCLTCTCGAWQPTARACRPTRRAARSRTRTGRVGDSPLA